MKRVQARTALIAAAAGAALLLMAIGAIRLADRPDGPAERETVAYVNGLPLAAAELRHSLKRQRAVVMDEFKRTYGVRGDAGFWHADNNGQSPAAMAKERALEEAVRTKLLLELAASHGLVPGASYEELLAEMERENERRQAALAAGQPIYGPVRFDEDGFADFYIGRIKAELPARLAGAELAVTDEQLRGYYERVKDDWFRLEDEVRFQLISVSYTADGRRGDATMIRAAESAAAGIGTRLETGESIEAIVTEYEDETANGAVPAFNVSEERMDSITARYYYKALPQLYEWLLADGADAGAVSPVIDDPAEGRFVLAVVAGREVGGYRSFEEQRDNVLNSYLDAALSDYVDKLAAEAEVTVVAERYERIEAWQ